MPDEPPSSPNLEQQILHEIVRIDREMMELQQERKALERTLYRVRIADTSTRDSTRTNSIDRLIAEKVIVDGIVNSGGKANNAQLYNAMRKLNPDTKEGTFRAYLHRLKGRGVIESHLGIRGIWKLPDNK